MELYRNATSIADLPELYNAAGDLIGTNLAAGRADKVAVIDVHGSTTYGQLARRVDLMAAALKAAGIHREQRVLLCLLDTVDLPTVFLGAIKAGIVPVPLNTLLVAKDYVWMLDNSGAAAVVVDGELTPHWLEIAAARSDVQFFSVGAGPWPRLDHMLASASPDGEPVLTHRDEVAFWLYTSGSTGNPKGAMHTHASPRLSANLYGFGIAGYREDDIVLSIAKQFFAYGLGNALTFPYAAGATAVLHNGRATPDTISALMRKHQVTVLGGVPTFFAGWFHSPDCPTREELPAFRLAISAGEALPAHLGEGFKQRFGVEVLDGLGSTEMLHIFLSQRPGEVRHGCTGRPVPGYELRLVNDEGSLAFPNEIGELQVKGPTVAAGYWKNRAKSQATFIGEWMRTGDKYFRDEEDWFHYAGRSDDMLKVGGIYVSPIEVEAAVTSHDSVLEAAVIGAKDTDGLIKPRAHVVLKPGYVGDAEMQAQLKAHVKAQLAPYKYPRWFCFTESLPKTATGKLQRYLLRDPG